MLLLLCSLIVCRSSSVLSFNEVDTLKSVSVVFRHGDRTPQEYPTGFYPNDPYLHMDFEPIGYGGLTNEGKRREFEIGIKLRERYSKFLSETYKPADISVVSTNYERTKQSLLLVLAGLYPPKGQQIWKDDLNWQPIPVNHITNELETFMYPRQCPIFKAEYEKYKNTSEYKSDLSRFDQFMKDLTVHMGRKVDDLLIVFHLYHTLAAESGMNLTLPDWTKTYFPNGSIADAILFEYETQSKTPLLRKLNGGLLTRKVLNDAVYQRKGKEHAKIHLYSCHEDNIAGFLFALNTWENSIPSYGSGVVVELHEEDSKQYLKILYYKGKPAEFEVRVIPGCTEYCPLEDFLRILEDQIPDDVLNACFGPPENSQLVPKDAKPIAWIYDRVRKWFHL